MPTIFSTSQVALDKRPVSKEKRAPAVVTPLTSFVVNPTGIRFETQQDDEHVVIFMRQHLIVNLGWVLMVILMLLTPTIVFPFILSALNLPFTIPVGYIIIGTMFWYVATYGYAIASFLRWFFNIYIVTNERIVDVDFIHLLYKELSETRLINVQDVTMKSGGVFEAVFNYGHIYIQTAGTEPNFEFLSIPNPGIIIQTISELAEKEKLRLK